MSSRAIGAVDLAFEQWSARGEYAKVRGKRGASLTPSDALALSASRGRAHAGRAAQARRVLERTVARTPEVMVKITGGAKSGANLRAHLDYISRNGKEAHEIEDQDGQQHLTAQERYELQKEWETSSAPIEMAHELEGGHLLNEQGGRIRHRRETFNILLSMPPSQEADSEIYAAAIKTAAREFAQTEFPNSHYAFVLHRDRAHPHVHLVVRAIDHDGKRLSPRKADLQRWRETFAERLNENGVRANATRRGARGATARYDKAKVYRMKARGIEPRERSYRSRAPESVTPSTVATARTAAMQYRSLSLALVQSPLPSDRRLAAELAHFVRAMPALRSQTPRPKVRPEPAFSPAKTPVVNNAQTITPQEIATHVRNAVLYQSLDRNAASGRPAQGGLRHVPGIALVRERAITRVLHENARRGVRTERALDPAVRRSRGRDR